MLRCRLSEGEANQAMLLELHAENYAVIDRATAAFGRGLNLMTGETGAGKSILIDALAMLLGGKASADFIRHGADKAVVSCLFEPTPGAAEVLEENGIDPDADGVLLRREIVATGKGRVFINNQAATVGVLRQLAPELALIHAQGETLNSFDQAQQRSLLDRFGGIALESVAAAYQTWHATVEKILALQSDEDARLRMADLWRFQAREIGDAAIAADDEDVQLEAERRVLANAEKLYAAAMGAHELLYEDEHSTETTLGQALKLMEELARFDPRFAEPVTQLQAAKAIIADISASARTFAEGIQAGPERLGEIADRLALLDRLKRKYGATLRDVIAFGEAAARQLAEVENRDELLAELRRHEAQQSSAYARAAEAVSLARRAAAQKLERAAERQINELAMNVRFRVSVESRAVPANFTAHGWDEIACLIATNAGEPLKPLDEIASGGEMSRVMLALKVTVEEAVVAGKRGAGQPRTLIFDEIDIGIGGRAAEAVGLKLKALARTQQVVCITHLPQIAAFADQHFLIEKKEAGGRTRTGIRQMTDEERVQEIARMLSGATLTETSLRHAENLLLASR